MKPLPKLEERREEMKCFCGHEFEEHEVGEGSLGSCSHMPENCDCSVYDADCDCEECRIPLFI